MNRNQEWQQRQTDRVNNLVLSKMSTAASQNRALNSVLALAGRGWRLFPVAGGGKKPLIRQWPALATPNAETIRNWTNSYPECNWAVACGPASGLWVLDVDGGDGAAAVLELCREHGDDWLETLTVQTKRGQHLYFHCPQDKCGNRSRSPTRAQARNHRHLEGRRRRIATVPWYPRRVAMFCIGRTTSAITSA